MNDDVYVTFAILTAIVCTLVGMVLCHKNNELEDGLIIGIPIISIIVGLLWPFAYILGSFVGVCYLLSYLVKRFT